MKSLFEYVDGPMTELIERLGGFFALNRRQYEQQRVKGQTYAKLPQEKERLQ